MDEDARRSQESLLQILDRIEALLDEVREKVIDGDPQMHEALRKAKDGDHTES